MAISESYIGPGPRWAMLVEDWPLATHQEALVSVDECDIPPRFRHKQKVNGGALAEVTEVCRCTINFGPNSPRPPVVAYRFPDDWAKGRSGNNYYCPTDDTATGWETWSSKTLHRALKEAGYPADAKEIQLHLLWRRRNAEIRAASRIGHEDDERVIAAAGAPDEDTAVAPAAQPEAPGTTEASKISDEVAATIKTTLDGFDMDRLKRWGAFLAERDWGESVVYHDSGEGRTARAFIASLSSSLATPAPKTPPPAPYPKADEPPLAEQFDQALDASPTVATEDEICARVEAMDYRTVVKELAARDKPTAGKVEALRPVLVEALLAERPYAEASPA